MIAYKDIEEEEKGEESKKNQRWFSKPTSENAASAEPHDCRAAATKHRC